MSFIGINEAMVRITAATIQSKIAVFVVTTNKLRHLNVVFANTVLTQQRINKQDENFVGVFFRGQKAAHVRQTLIQALK